MIVSHKHKYIFIKTTKSAGTSIEIALSRHCGPHDIITKVSPEDQAIRKQIGGAGPQNHIIPFSEYRPVDWIKFLKKQKRKKISSHAGGSYVKSLVGNSTWNSYYKFCFERNPWDRTVSLYFHFLQDRRLKKELDNCSISEFIKRGYPRELKKRGIDLYCIDNEIAVDRVCLYENLEEELTEVVNNKLGIREKLSLPKAKGAHRKDKRHYREILSDSDRQLIESMFAREIELFGFRF